MMMIEEMGSKAIQYKMAAFSKKESMTSVPTILSIHSTKSPNSFHFTTNRTDSKKWRKFC